MSKSEYGITEASDFAAKVFWSLVLQGHLVAFAKYERRVAVCNRFTWAVFIRDWIYTNT